MMDSIRNRMMTAYGYDPGEYEGYINETDNNKLLVKLDWNVNHAESSRLDESGPHRNEAPGYRTNRRDEPEQAVRGHENPINAVSARPIVARVP